MDVATLALAAVFIAFCGCLLAIALCDLSSYSIPNFVSVAMLWLFVVALPFARTEVSLPSHFGSFLVVLGVGILAFRLGVFGGGDVKSWAAAAAWYGIYDLPTQILYVTLIGGLLGLLVLALRRVAVCEYIQNRVPDRGLPRLLRPGEPVPYGLAIAAGTILSAGHIDLFRSLAF